MAGEQVISPSGSISLLAPAKVNLFLHITARRDDGYHELESLFVRTNFGDRVTVEAAEALSLIITGPFADELKKFPIESNLVMQAAKLMLTHCGKNAGAKITLEKALPVASGIGGGSADAAATLLALKELWQVEIPEGELMAMALKLGADVPACLGYRPQWVSGVGELCEDVTLGFKRAILLVNPCDALSTPEVFKVYQQSGAGYSPKVEAKREILNSLASLEVLTQNDLYEPAMAVSSQISEVMGLLSSLPKQQLVRMSGSGATCFALFNDLADAEKARQIICKKKPTWWVDSGDVID